MQPWRVVRLPVAFSNGVWLIGARIGTQFAVVDFGTVTPTKIVMSNALETTVGGSQ